VFGVWVFFKPWLSFLVFQRDAHISNPKGPRAWQNTCHCGRDVLTSGAAVGTCGACATGHVVLGPFGGVGAFRVCREI
jgi:hypothetical protein